MTERVSQALAEAERAAGHLRAAQRKRDEAVWEAKDAGASYAQIAQASGLTRSGVQGIMGRRPSQT